MGNRGSFSGSNAAGA